MISLNDIMLKLGQDADNRWWLSKSRRKFKSNNYLT